MEIDLDNSGRKRAASPVISGCDYALKYGIFHTLWKCVIKRDFILQNDIWFREKVAREDGDYMTKVLFYARTVKYEPISLYHYRMNEDSVTHSHTVKLFLSDIEMLLQINHFNELTVRGNEKMYKLIQRGIWGSLFSYPKLLVKYYSIKDIVAVNKKLYQAKLHESLETSNWKEKLLSVFLNKPYLYSCLIFPVKAAYLIRRSCRKKK